MGLFFDHRWPPIRRPHWPPIRFPFPKQLVLAQATPTGISKFWDMSGFSSGLFGNPPGIGKGAGTATVAGKVFDEYAINYWLAGLIYNSMQPEFPVFAKDFEFAVLTYPLVIAAPISYYVNGAPDSPYEKWDWFFAGAADDPNQPLTPSWLAGVQPGLPGTDKIHWTWGFITGVA